MLKSTGICAADVTVVAEQLGFNPTIDNIREVLDMYPNAQEFDPTANWSLVVEECLYQLGVEQRPKQKVK